MRIVHRLWTVAAIANMAIAGLCATTLIQVYQASTARGWVDRTEEVIVEAAATLARVTEAETSQRGYLLTREPAYASRYHELAAERARVLDRLKLLTAEDDVQQAQVAQLDGLVVEKFGLMDKTLALAIDGRYAEAIGHIAEANRAMDLVRQGFATLATTARASLDRRRSEAHRINTSVKWGVVVIGCLAGAIVTYSCFWIVRRLGRDIGTLLEGIAVVGGGNLDHRLPENNGDETDAIAKAFNQMGRRLEETQRVRDQAEHALQESNAKLLARGTELEERTSAINVLGKMVHRLLVATNETEFGEVVSLFVPQILPGIPGALYLFNNSRNLLTRAAVWNHPSSDQQFFMPKDCWGLRRGRRHLVGEDQSEVWCPHVGEAQISGYLCLPLLAQGDIVGLLYFETPSVPGLGAGGGYDYTAVLAENIALAVVNHRLRERLRDQSVRDPLTGLFNRRFLEEASQVEFARALRSGTPIGILMIDVDHFKRFNDKFGHDAGDYVLHAVAQAMKSRVRDGDLVCRYGGEEFLVLMPGATEAQAAERAEQIRQTVGNLAIIHHGASLGAVTISLGVAMFPLHGDTPKAVIEAADLALYQAKESGRDRVVAAAPTAGDDGRETAVKPP